MKRKETACAAMLGASFAALLTGLSLLPAAALAAPAAAQIRIDADDIGGVVTGAKGPEAGVWVIAETRDLPTKYVKIVVTDDAGRYVLPDLPKANYDIWVRGYGLVDSPKVKSAARQAARSQSGVRAEPRRGGRLLSRHLLVLDAAYPGSETVPRHRAARQRHAGNAEGSGPVAALCQDRRLHPLPSARRSRDAHNSRRARSFQHQRRSLGAPHPVGTGRARHGRCDRAVRYRASIAVARRLDRPRRQRRTAQSRSVPPAAASNATSSSPNGIGTRPRPMSMTAFRPTSAIRASMRTA